MFSSNTLTAKLEIFQTLEGLSFESSFPKNFKIEPGNKVKLGSIAPSYCGEYQSQEEVLPEMLVQLQKMDRLQNLMYAERKHSLLIVLQGLDACGKDGVARHIITGMNPAGCHVIGFKQPRPDDLKHDFLWRIHPNAPPKGEVAIFNRSHYEDVLVVRVHHLVPVRVWSKRYELINGLEKLLVEANDTTILKFFLHISKEEQLARFKQRLDDPARRWKITDSDYRERDYWEDYMQAFEDMLRKTSTQHAPWFVIPSNHKWFRDLAVSQIITRTLEALNMQMPETTVDVARIRRRYHAAEAKASAGEVSPIRPNRLSVCEPLVARPGWLASG